MGVCPLGAAHIHWLSWMPSLPGGPVWWLRGCVLFRGGTQLLCKHRSSLPTNYTQRGWHTLKLCIYMLRKC